MTTFGEVAARAASTPDHLDVDNFCDFLQQVILLLESFGRTLSLAFSGKPAGTARFERPGPRVHP